MISKSRSCHSSVIKLDRFAALNLDVNEKVGLTNGSTQTYVKYQAEELLKSLVSGMGMYHMTFIFNHRTECYFSDFCEPLERLMNQPITDEFKEEINRAMTNLIDWILNTYLVQKAGGATKVVLYNMLKQEIESFRPKLSQLQHPSISESALGVFVISASIHFVMLQEMAIIDPEVNNFWQSEYINEIKNYADFYLEHLDSCWMRLLNARMNCFTDVSLTVVDCDLENSQSAVATVKFADKHTGQRYIKVTKKGQDGKWDRGLPEDLHENAMEVKVIMQSDAIDHLDVTLATVPLQSTSVWTILLEQPLPQLHPLALLPIPHV